jgi:pyruvate dehydrogenase E1 component beta subunit
MAEVTFFNALREAIDEEMERDPAVYVLGEDVGHYGGSYKVTKDLYKKYGDLRPIIEGMNMGFLLLAFNQISNNAGMLRYTSGGNFKIPIVIRGPGGVGRNLGAEHSQRLETYFQAVPGIKMVACSTPYNAKGLLKSAIRNDNPILFFEHVLLYNLKEDIPDEEYLLPLDKAEIVREGNDVTILTYSRMRYHVLKAVETLVDRGYDPEVIDLISLKPLDMDTIVTSLRKTHRIVIVEEGMRCASIGSEIIASINDGYFDELDAPIVRLAALDVPTPYNGGLENLTIPQPEDVIAAVEKLLA